MVIITAFPGHNVELKMNQSELCDNLYLSAEEALGTGVFFALRDVYSGAVINNREQVSRYSVENRLVCTFEKFDMASVLFQYEQTAPFLNKIE